MMQPMKDTGGINLSTTNKLVQAQGLGIGIKFHINQAQLALWQEAPGIAIRDVTIEPLKSLSAFLGSS